MAAPRNGIELVAGKKLPARVAKSTPKRITEQMKPGGGSVSAVYSRTVPEKDPRVDVPMSTPPCLLSPDTEAGKKRSVS
jgi:hypothetical protein